MNLSAPFIARPVATALLMVVLVALGAVAYALLPVAALPEIASPTVLVSAQLPGADPATITSAVTVQLERQFGEIAGLHQMTSSSGAGYAAVTMQFDRSRTVDSAAQDVQAAINATQGQLPPDLLTPPTYRKTNPAETPILLIALTSDTFSILTVSDFANSVLAQKIAQVPGVGLVNLGGLQSPSIHVQVNPSLLAAQGLGFETVRAALAKLSVEQPKGQLYGNQQAVALDTNDQLTTPAGFNEAVVAVRDGAPVRVRDIGRAVKASWNPTLAGELDGRPAVILAIQRSPGANVIATVAAIRKALPQLRAALPPGIDVRIVSDRTQTIAASVVDVRHTLYLTIGLVVLVIALFLRRFWATVIPAVAVPISLVGSFAAMYLAGYSLDNLSLMALTIAVGFVVDDAIVMVEAIVRHVEDGATPMQAALKGAGAIGFTVLSISVSLIAVFIPLFLMSGVVGLLFREFAGTVAVAIALSVLVSLTLTPMLCARLLPARAAEPNRLSRFIERVLDRLLQAYARGLDAAIRHSRITLAVMLATVAATVALYVVIPKGFFPEQDTGLIVGISEAAADISPQGMKERQDALVTIAARDPAVASAVGYIGPGGPTVAENQGRVFITLRPESRRPPVGTVMARLARAVDGVGGIKLYMQAAQDITIGARLAKSQYQFTLTGIDGGALDRYGPQLLAKLRLLPELTAVGSDQEATSRALHVEIDRSAAARYGIDPGEIDATLDDAFGQRHVGRIYTTLNQYYVILEVDPRDQLGPDALRRIYVTSRGGKQVPLSQICRLSTGTAATAVNHQDQFPSVTLSFDLAPGATIGSAVAAVERAAADLHVPGSITYAFQGSAQAFQTSLASTPPLILAALFAVYAILGILYENTIHPLTILSTLPAAGLGALATLMGVGRPLDVIGIIGIILLIGIVKKNGIMLVDVALDRQRAGGLTAAAAVREAALTRFRPILMTTLCALFGGVPLMLGTGIGSEIRQPLGYAIVGGLAVSQVLTLFTTPIVYLYMDGLSRALRRPRRKRLTTEAADGLDAA